MARPIHTAVLRACWGSLWCAALIGLGACASDQSQTPAPEQNVEEDAFDDGRDAPEPPDGDATQDALDESDGVADIAEPDEDVATDDVQDDTGDPPDDTPDDHPTRPNDLDQDQLFACQQTPGASPARIRRLESVEWSKNITSDRGLLVPFLGREEHRYSTYSTDESMDTATLREYMRHNGVPGGTWSLHSGNGHPRIVNLRGMGSLVSEVRCFQWNWNDQPVEADPSAECTDRFVRLLLEHGVLFRPPTEAEVAHLTAFAQSQLEREQADPGIDRRDTIETIVRAAWMMTGAIFRSEMGEDEVDEHGRHRLKEHELGKALSLALGDHAAGLSKAGYGNDNIEHKVMLFDVMAAVEDGTISQPEVIERLTRRYLAGADPAVLDPQMDASDYPPGYNSFLDMYWVSPKLQRFFREWLGYDTAHAIFKDTPEATSAFSSSPIPNRTRYHNWLANAYNSSEFPKHLDATIARIVAEDERVLARLLTDQRFLLPAASGSDLNNDREIYRGYPYNIDVTQDGAIGASLDERWIELPQDERAGVLTHPAWLAAHGGNFENDPSAIHRGKWVYEELLCMSLPELPPTVDAMLDPASAELSARERLTTQIDADPYCNGCHVLMNPLGYPFEIYNHAGFVRVEDHGAPPSGHSTLLAVPSDDTLSPGMEVLDAIDMMDKMSRSTRVKRCFVRQSFRFFMGRDETYADACTLQSMETAYDDSNGSMVDMLVALFQSDAFLYRHRNDDAQE